MESKNTERQQHLAGGFSYVALEEETFVALLLLVGEDDKISNSDSEMATQSNI